MPSSNILTLGDLPPCWKYGFVVSPIMSSFFVMWCPARGLHFGVSLGVYLGVLGQR